MRVAANLSDVRSALHVLWIRCLSKKYTPPQFVGKWTVTFANGVVETCDVRANWTVSESEPKRSADGKAEVKGNALVISCADNRLERWTTVD